MKKIAGFIAIITILSSCVSKKKYSEAVSRQSELNIELSVSKARLDRCLAEKDSVNTQYKIKNASNIDLKDRINTLNQTNAALMQNMGDLTSMSKEGAKNLEKTLESIKEKDSQIYRMRDAITKRDSLTLALVTSLKGALGDLEDEDIEVNVEKGVVFIAIADKLLFSSGSYKINEEAKMVLGKVAKVVNDKPEIEFMVEGHTDNVPISKDCIADNWDLSVLRAAAVVRLLEKDFNIKPSRMTAAGRSSFVPKVSNDSEAGKSKNRRTRIIVLPKFDQFYTMVEEGMKKAIQNDK